MNKYKNKINIIQKYFNIINIFINILIKANGFESKPLCTLTHSFDLESSVPYQSC